MAAMRLSHETQQSSSLDVRNFGINFEFAQDYRKSARFAAISSCYRRITHRIAPLTFAVQQIMFGRSWRRNAQDIRAGGMVR
jgi:hypothetical protein